MSIAKVIRKYRKERGFTQEEMALRLGVTAPAVNKWENGNSMPDITLLAPLARLLDISLDTLLSFQEELTDEDATELLKTLSHKLKTEPFSEAFRWAKSRIAEYPNSEHLLLWMTVTLDGHRITTEIPNAEEYDGFFQDAYTRLLLSSEEYTRTTAADSLYGFYIRKEQYEKAEEYLKYFSDQNPNKKQKQALLYEKSGRTEEAFKAYEELLFSTHSLLYITLHSLFSMSLKKSDLEKACYLSEKMVELERLFEMGEYFEYSTALDLAQARQDKGQTLLCAERIFAGLRSYPAFSSSPLYGHMTWKEPAPDFCKNLRENLVRLFQDKNEFRYMESDERWEVLLKENKAVNYN